MRVRLLAFWQGVRASYWFVPVLMAIGSIGLASAVIELESWLGRELVQSIGWIYSGGVDGARGVLTTIAGSAITVASTTFSITIASLSLASNQFGPRVLRGFMRDRGNQVVLGTFASTFLYCLLVLRTVRGGEDGVFVPHLGVTVAVTLSVLCVGVLIYFIHHTARSIQVAHIVHVAGADLDHAIERLFPERIGSAQGEGELPTAPPRHVVAKHEGYLSAVDAEQLMAIARERDLQIRVEARPGNYLLPGDCLAAFWPAEAEGAEEAIAQCYVLSSERSPHQDARFAFQQLAEVAVRALSPSLNDPYTAIVVIDRLAASLVHLDARNLPPSHRFDDQGHLRVVAAPHGFGELVTASFAIIAAAAAPMPSVVDHLAGRLSNLSDRARHPEMRRALDALRSHLIAKAT